MRAKQPCPDGDPGGLSRVIVSVELTDSADLFAVRGYDVSAPIEQVFDVFPREK